MEAATQLIPDTELAPAKPVLKWAGGKTQLLPVLSAVMPPQFGRYAEPFLGGGAVFFSMAPRNALLADSNPELMHFYAVVPDSPDALYRAASALPTDAEDYYGIRALDPDELDEVNRAARFLYLNKTCYNGLH